MELGKLLAKLRKEKGVLQKEVATYLNVTVATISNLNYSRLRRESG